jgi:hypothetical protein
MITQTDDTVLSSKASAARPTRTTLRTRPIIQRLLIRSWEYIEPVRITILAIRLLVVLWLLILSALLLTADYTWGWAVLAGAGVTFAVSFWVFSTAAKGWPAVAA